MFTTVYGDNTWQYGSQYFLRKIRENSQIRSVYDTDTIRCVFLRQIIRSITDRIDTLYGRKYPVFTTFTVRFPIVNDAVLIDLGIAFLFITTAMSLIFSFFSTKNNCLLR